MAEKALTVLFMPESAHGPTNNCIGIADVLRERGHRAVFAAEASWKGKLEPLGFEEELVELAAPPDGPEVLDAGQFWKDFVASTAPEFKKPTIDQLDSWIRPVWQELIAGARHCEAQLNVITERVHPDVVVEDNVVCFPALLTAGAPFVRVVSCNPLEMKASDLPPTFSGYPSFDSSSWQDFRAEYEAVMRPVFEEFDAWVRDEGAPGLPDLEFIHEGAANLYVYPECADYARKEALGPTWWRLDSSVRETERAFVLPESLRGTRGGGGRGTGGGALIYFSLGSLGSADVSLMRRIIGVLAETPHRYIVSLGPRHAEIELAPNMWGAELVPQTEVIALVDLVITHGGNNTTVESLHFGKPMIVLPLFWDQYDNAQRMAELGYGIRLDTYGFSDAELLGAIERLLEDHSLRRLLTENGEETRRRDGLRKAGDIIEQVAARG